MFTRMLEHARLRPQDFAAMARELFGAMSAGGRVGFETVAWFNGGLFDSDDALALTREEIETTLEAAALDWSEIDPSILGTLFERGLDPAKRSQLGAHYTDRDKIMQIIEPVVTRPWPTRSGKRPAPRSRFGWSGPTWQPPTAGRTRQRGQAERTLRDFLEKLRAFTVLDPACGSGNFLYLALHALKDLEHRVQLEAESMGLQRAFPAVGPASVKGIEINPYAAEPGPRLRLDRRDPVVWRRNGFSGARDPILDPLDTIECRDAILNPDGSEPDWPAADVVIGNPPFLGRQAAAKFFGRGLCRVNAAIVRGQNPRRGRSRLPLVRQGATAGCRRQDCPRRSSRHQLDPGWPQPPRAGPDCRAERNLRCLVGRAVGSGWRGGKGFTGLLCWKGRRISRLP